MGSDETDSGAPVPADAASGGAAPTADVHAAFTRRLLAKRHEKDAFFARSANSPLAPDRRRAFAGLAYYPPDPSYRLTGLRLEPTGGDPGPSRSTHPTVGLGRPTDWADSASSSPDERSP